QPEEVLQCLRKRAKEPFDMERGLIRAFLFARLGEQNYLLIVVHHLVFDGSSVSLLMSALSEAYIKIKQGKEPVLEPLQASYSDFVAWEQDFLSSNTAEADKAYWLQQLSGTLPVLKLYSDMPAQKEAGGFGRGAYNKPRSV